MEKKKVESIHIYSYSKVWSLEHSIYSLGNINLPVPIHPYDLLYFVGTLVFIVLLCKVIPVLSLFPVIIRYILTPYGLTTFLRKKKLDGKNPLKYFIAYAKYYLFEKGQYFERFRRFTDRVDLERLSWICSVKYHRR